MEVFTDVVRAYNEFADSADGASPCFAEWGRSVVTDEELVAWISLLPPIKQQPNLVFAAARWHGVPAPGDYAALRTALLSDTGPIRDTILTRRTQTNEVARLATLTPVFGLVAEERGRDLSLVEVGASAGLCLYPDRWDYAWAPAGSLRGSGGPTFTCRTEGDLPVPRRHPQVAWRGGVDLNPLALDDDDAMAWLTTLVWPEQEERRSRLTEAIAIARAEPPVLRRGDLLTELPDLVVAAAEHGDVVVFHSAVIVYLEEADRRRFAAMMVDLVADGACRWVSNEAAGVLPQVTATAPGEPAENPSFVLGLDGRALAWTHGHGASMTWFGAVD